MLITTVLLSSPADAMEGEMKARLLKNNLLVNMQWEPEYPDKLESGTLTWFRNSVKSNRKLFYTDAFGHVATGYTAKLS